MLTAALNLKVDEGKIVRAMLVTAAIASQSMANDVREKAVNAIMGNRKSANNPFPKNVVNPKTGRYMANSVARKPPKAPKSYTMPGKPISIAQVKYEKSDKSKEKIGDYTIPVRSYKAGPIAGGKVSSQGSVPYLLEHGGTTKSAWREIKNSRGNKTVRWEFRKEKPKNKRSSNPHVGKRPARYSSWRDVNQRMRERGQQVGGVRKQRQIVETNDGGPAWNPPKTWVVKPRPFMQDAKVKVVKRAKHHLGRAQRHFPRAYKVGKYFEVAV